MRRGTRLPFKLILATALIPKIESVQLTVLNQNQSLLGTGRRADGNADDSKAAVFGTEMGWVQIGCSTPRKKEASEWRTASSLITVPGQ